MPNPLTGQTSPLRILITRRFAAELEAVLDIPHVLTTLEKETPEEIAPLLAQTDVFATVRFKAGWLPADPIPLRLVQLFGAGTDSIDFSVVPSGCAVCNVYGHEYGIAEHVFMVMAALNRELFIQDAELRRGNWGHRGYYRELRGRNLLVVGLGHIGAEVARWGRFMNMRVTGITRSPSPERGQQLGLEALGGPSDLDTYLANADFVVLAVPHTPQTGAMVGRSQLQQMKPTAYLINVARGPVVDEAALYTALKEGAIAGAGIDVWYRYPEPGQTQQMPSAYPLHELDNVILTPHTSGMTDGTFQHRWAAVAENLRRLAAGEPLKNIVWPQQAR